MLPGLSLTESLFSVLIRFRLHIYVFSADIEKVFLQIILDGSKLYFKDLDDLCTANTNNLESIAVYRVGRVLFALPSSPFLLSGRLIHHAHNYASLDQAHSQTL